MNQEPGAKPNCLTPATITVATPEQGRQAVRAYRCDGEIYVPETELALLFGGQVTWEEATGAPAAGQACGALSALPPAAAAALDAATTRLGEIARFICANPERGNTEVQAAAMLTGELEKHGFAVERGLPGVMAKTGEAVHLATAFKAVKEGNGPGPTIGIMLEYDALPMGHGCGHNLIAVAGLGAALGLSAVMADCPGRLLVFGTPAEDGGPMGGKIPMLGAGLFEGVDIALISHGGDRWDTGSLWLGTKSANFTFRGAPAHAAAAPHQGRSALDAVVLMFAGIEMMREHVRTDTRLHGIITKGGTASNIVPEEAQATVGVRSLDNEYLKELCVRVENVAKGAALATGCRLDIDWFFSYSPTINVPALDKMVLDNARQLGAAPMARWTTLASSDLGDVGQVIPTVNLWFAVAPTGTELHTHEFLQASSSQAGIDAAVLAARVLAASGYQLLNQPELVQQIQAEYKEIKSGGGR